MKERKVNGGCVGVGGVVESWRGLAWHVAGVLDACVCGSVEYATMEGVVSTVVVSSAVS